MRESVTAKKTNVIRLLEAERVPHRVHTYSFSEEHPDAVTAAHQVGVEPDRVFKTLVASGGGTTYLVFCLPSVFELNLRRAADVSGCRQVELVSPDRLLPLTGYLRGGCSPLAMKKAFPTFLEETARIFDTILVSAGQRGVQVELAPHDLVTLGQRLLPRMAWASLA